MAKMPHAGEDHGQAVLVAGGDGFGIADRAARLDDSADAGAGRFVHVVAKWEERIGGEHAARDAVAGLAHRHVRRIHAAHLPGAHAERRIDGGIDDGIGFHMIHHPPAKKQRAPFAVRRRPFRDDLAIFAAGRFDGFWEFGLKPWDLAAGALLIQEAGGIVSDIRGNGNYFDSGNLVAGNLKLQQEMLAQIGPHLAPEMNA